MNTGENIQGLRKVGDLSRSISVVLLMLHYYVLFYPELLGTGLTNRFSDRLLAGLFKTGFLDVPVIKSAIIFFLVLSLLGVKGKKDKSRKSHIALSISLIGCSFYLFGHMALAVTGNLFLSLICYTIINSLGYLLLIVGMTQFARIIHLEKGIQDIFNSINQTFPQQQVLLKNEYSINLPTEFSLGSKRKNGWINIINPFRAILVLGNPGSGKSYYVIRHIISQHIQKGFTMFVYDFKYDDLSRIAYHHWKKNRSGSTKSTSFFRIDFDDLQRTHRCNPLEPSAMKDITDAAESARTILLGLNRDWIKRQGDFFVESAINLLTAVIWYLRKYDEGTYCTLPHVIELMQQDYDRLFSLLRSQSEIQVLVNPFVNAYLNDAMEQLEGQVASTKIALARISSPQIYYVLSGNDFDLDINNPDNPKIICMGNNPQKIQTYGAVLSLYVNRLIKQVNRKGVLKSSLVFDEFPTIYLNNIDSLIATARSNRVSTTLCVQDISQLRKDYGRDLADVILNIVGNVISGQVSGETAKQLSDRFGRIVQPKRSISVNSNDTSVSHSTQLDTAIPASVISSLSAGEFVGLVADDPKNPVELKSFHARIINDHRSLQLEEQEYSPAEQIGNLQEKYVHDNYRLVKSEVSDLVISEMDRLLSDPSLRHLVVSKK
ncbi:conjugal transfer protein MobC [Sphingobacterium sp. CZ-2]|uniref:conjugal transfer protein MobC n=1 Tax=Sphingobacterium sp. CZ-2 TaxID=2557994 RepID=UPI00106F21C7|nr:conjugal transfer protein MobC [Sphingobacterium sp. CZ-2]QBR13569.1 conjugal transfer protein TraG [Sphingobacterium sp. CZ-2]